MLRGAQGDPFLGALIPALGAIGRFVIPKVAGAIGRVFSGGRAAAAARGTRAASVGARVSAAPGRPASRSAAISRVSSIARQFLPAAAAGGVAAAAGAAIQTFIGPDGEMMVRPRRRRMNPLNPKALRRATRRLSSFNKMAKKTQSELAKLAPPRSRRAPARHHHDDHHHHSS